MKSNSIFYSIKNIVLNEFWLKMCFLISMLLSASPFIHLVIAPFIKILLVWGMLILIYQLLRQRERYKNVSSMLVIAFIISYGITVFVNSGMNFIANVKIWCYMMVILLVIFSVDPKKKRDAIVYEIKQIIWAFTIVSFCLSVVSFGTFVFSIKGHGMYESQWVYYGMFENRLWGIYNPSTGSAINTISILLLAGYWIYFKPQKKVVRAVLCMEMIIHYFCLLLTNSRTALYTLIIGVAGLIFLTIGYYSKKKEFSIKKLAVQIACALLGCCILFTTVNPIREGLAYVPGLVKIFVNSVEEGETKEEIEKEELTRMEELEERPGGILTGRTELWKAGIQTFKESPLFGIARENVNIRVANNLEDDYWLRDLQRGGLHNIYITVLVCSGIVGFVFFVLIVLSLLAKCIKYVFSEKMKQNQGIPLIIIPVLIVQLIMEFLEARILYQVNIFYIIFWCIAGYFMFFFNQSEKDIINEV